MNSNNDQKITFTVADVNDNYGDLLRKLLPSTATMYSPDPANLIPELRSWFMYVADDYNCAYDEDEGPLAYHTIGGLSRLELNDLALKFRDQTIDNFVSEVTYDDADKNFNLLFLIFQFAFIIGDASYLLPLTNLVTLSFEDHKEVKFNIRRLK